jgi:uncharacterized membrane protein
VRALLAFSAVLWAVALPAAALAAQRSAGTASAEQFLALGVYQLGSIICHQRPERSFHLGSMPFPVCARCTGIYAGAAATGIVALAVMASQERRTSRNTARPHGSRRDVMRSRAALAVCAAPALVTLLVEWAGGRAPSNEIRALSGLALGGGVAWVLMRLE